LLIKYEYSVNKLKYNRSFESNYLIWNNFKRHINMLSCRAQGNHCGLYLKCSSDSLELYHSHRIKSRTLTTCSATACCTKTSKSSSFGINKLTLVENSASAILFGTNLMGSSSSANQTETEFFHESIQIGKWKGKNKYFDIKINILSVPAGSGSCPKREDLEFRGRVLRSGLKKAIPACLKSVAGLTGDSLIFALTVLNFVKDCVYPKRNSNKINFLTWLIWEIRGHNNID